MGVKCQPFHWLLWVLLLVGVKILLHSYGFYIGVGIIDYQPISLEIELEVQTERSDLKSLCPSDLTIFEHQIY